MNQHDSVSSLTRNPFVFVVGCPRSGTTLLQRMLDNHPQLAVAYDTLFIPAAVRGNKLKNPPVTPELVERVRTFKRFSRFGLGAETLDQLAPEASDYAHLVSLLYDAFARLHGKPLGGEKSPGYVRHMPMLQALFPEARFVHLVRDGRDVALSLLDWGKGKNSPKGPARKYRLWAHSPLGVCALWWVRKAGQGRLDAQRLPSGRLLEVRYEALVADPAPELRKIAAFLGLDYTDDMVNFHVGKTRETPGLSAKTAWLPATGGIRDWRRSMPDRDVELFEALAGDLLSGFGYERRFPEIGKATASLARELRLAWDEELAGTG